MVSAAANSLHGTEAGAFSCVSVVSGVAAQFCLLCVCSVSRPAAMDAFLDTTLSGRKLYLAIGFGLAAAASAGAWVWTVSAEVRRDTRLDQKATGTLNRLVFSTLRRKRRRPSRRSQRLIVRRSEMR